MSNLYISKIRVVQAFTTLLGLIDGITADEIINETEISSLIHWIKLNEMVVAREPFKEILKVLNEALSDNILSNSELADIKFVCENILRKFGNDDERTHSLQKLHGIVSGIAVDRKLNSEEWNFLKNWTGLNPLLKGSWPFDEIEALTIKHKDLNTLTNDEYGIILHYFNDFCGFNSNAALTHPLNETGKLITGICSVCPDVVIRSRLFCFTGNSPKASKLKLKEIVTKLGGEYKDGISQQVDYLVVCSSGSPMWTYSCYGRKVEEAIRLRQKGHQIQIVHESDFWDCIQDAA